MSTQKEYTPKEYTPEEYQKYQDRAERAEKYGETALEFDPEHNKAHEKLCLAAGNIIDCYDWQPDKEEFLIVTDTKVIDENPFMLRALERELEKRAKDTQDKKPGASHFRILTTKASPKSATPLGSEIGEAMRDNPVLIITSMSMSHSQETGAAMRGDAPFKREDMEKLIGSEGLKTLAKKGFSGIRPETLDAWQGRVPDKEWQRLMDLARQNRSRIISITKGHNPYNILTEGAVFEKVETLRDRAEKVNALIGDVARAHITTPLGTDLWLTVRPEFTEVEDGKLNKPGKVSNYPIGEWSCSPDWPGSDGILVVDGPCGGNINQDILDKGAPLKLTIKDGEVVAAEGGEEVLRLWRAYLDSGNNDKNQAYKLAELGIGTNGKALENKPRAWWGSSEGEKVYGTCHIAVGSNGTFGRPKEDPCYNAAQVHCDMVLGLNQGGEVTVECERKDGTRFILIDKGNPVGY